MGTVEFFGSGYFTVGDVKATVTGSFVAVPAQSVGEPLNATVVEAS